MLTKLQSGCRIPNSKVAVTLGVALFLDICSNNILIIAVCLS